MSESGFSGFKDFQDVVESTYRGNHKGCPYITALTWSRAWAKSSLAGAGGTPALPFDQPVLVISA